MWIDSSDQMEVHTQIPPSLGLQHTIYQPPSHERQLFKMNLPLNTNTEMGRRKEISVKLFQSIFSCWGEKSPQWNWGRLRGDAALKPRLGCHHSSLSGPFLGWRNICSCLYMRSHTTHSHTHSNRNTQMTYHAYFPSLVTLRPHPCLYQQVPPFLTQGSQRDIRVHQSTLDWPWKDTVDEYLTS